MAKTWQTLVDEAIAGIYPALEAMTDNQLRNVRSATKKATSTNCWWLTYACVPAVADAANMILKARLQRRRKAKQEGSAP